LHNFTRKRNDNCANQTNIIAGAFSFISQSLNYLPLQGWRAKDNAFEVTGEPSVTAQILNSLPLE
jgi:hypothetical protein